MRSLPVWMPVPMFLLGGPGSLVPCSFRGVVFGPMFHLGGLCPGGLYKGDNMNGEPPAR